MDNNIFQPLTPEQYQSARNAGFSPDQILTNERIRKAQSFSNLINNPSETETLNPIQKFTSGLNTVNQGIQDFGVGVLKGAGRSMVNLANVIPSSIQSLSGVKNPTAQRNEQLLNQLQPTNTTQKAGGYLETAGEFLIPGIAEKEIAGESFINKARSLYQSALKPSTTLSNEEKSKIIQTGLNEAVTVSQRGLEKLGEKINQLETSLDIPIKEAAKNGARISVETLRPYIDDAKRILGKTADPLFSDKAVNNVETRFEALKQKYPTGIPLDLAQELKINTYQLIKKAYGKLSTSTIEFQKQVARGLKDKIVEGAPIVGEINSRLKNLYEFEQQVEKAANRTANRDIVGLGTKILATGKGPLMKTLSVVNELFGPAAKSFNAIQLNKLGQKLVGKSQGEIKLLKELSKYVAPVDLINLIEGSRKYLKD